MLVLDEVEEATEAVDEREEESELERELEEVSICRDDEELFVAVDDEEEDKSILHIASQSFFVPGTKYEPVGQRMFD